MWSFLLRGFVWLASAACGQDCALDRLADDAARLSAYEAAYDAPTTHTPALDMLAVRLTQTARAYGLAIFVVPLDPAIAGYLDRTALPQPGTYPPAGLAGSIYINEAYGFDARTQILAHELAHFVAPPLPPAEAQVFADAVSYLLVRKAGVRDARAYVSYLAGFKSALPALAVYRAEIKAAVRAIEAGTHPRPVTPYGR